MTLTTLFQRVCVVLYPEKCPEILTFSCPEKHYCAQTCTSHQHVFMLIRLMTSFVKLPYSYLGQFIQVDVVSEVNITQRMWTLLMVVPVSYYNSQLSISAGVLASVGWWEVWQPSPQGGSRSLQWSETGMEDPQEDPLAVYCFCVCSGSAPVGRSPWGKQIQGTWSCLFCRFILGFYSYSLCIVAFYSAICWWVLIALV